MKAAWTVLLITAGTDFVIAFGTAITAVMAESKDYPGGPAMMAAVIGAVVIFARTIQQALKTTATTSAELRGVPNGGGA